MATPFFGKREIGTPAASNTLNTPRPAGQDLSPAYGNTAGQSSSSSIVAAKPFEATPTASVGSPTFEVGSKLTVGPNIKLKEKLGSDSNTVQLEAFFTRMTVLSFTFKGSPPFLGG